MKIKQLYHQFDNCPICYQEKNHLKHILGVGKLNKAKFFLVLINPTDLNLSAHPGWQGKRFPFIGVKSLWRVFAKAEIISQKLLERIEKKAWDNKTSHLVEQELKNRNIYLSNLVKCCATNPEPPGKEKIKSNWSLFQEEISIINPKYIVAFGLLPFKKITGIQFKMSEQLKAIKNKRLIIESSLPIKNKTYPVVPCHFPVGRGNPREAVLILKSIQNLR